MDLGLYSRVIWRFRFLVIAGLLVALVLSLLSVARVSFRGGSPTIGYRHPETWESQTRLLITQRGFPWGRAVFPFQAPPDSGSGKSLAPQFADPSRFSDLAVFYSQLANSDAVQAMLARGGPLKGAMSAQPAFTAQPGLPVSSSRVSVLPFIVITGTATTPEDAVEIAERGSDAFRRYLAERQKAAAIPPSQRVRVQVLNRPRDAEIVAGHGTTVPAIVFLTVMIATLGLAFILENLRPRVRAVAEGPGTELERAAQARRTA